MRMEGLDYTASPLLLRSDKQTTLKCQCGPSWDILMLLVVAELRGIVKYVEKAITVTL
jgi:hypothetical protein